MTNDVEVKPTLEQLQKQIAEAVGKKDWKQVTAISKKIAELEAEKEKAEREAKLASLAKFTKIVSDTIAKTIEGKVVADAVAALGDVAEGIWFALDFGAAREVGINPSCRLVKVQKGAKGGSTKAAGSGSGSYVAGLPATSEMLDKVGSHIMFKEDTTVTIDKKEVVMKAGTTFKQAHDFSDNGGWRNRVRMALGKEMGLTAKAS